MGLARGGKVVEVVEMHSPVKSESVAERAGGDFDGRKAEVTCKR